MPQTPIPAVILRPYLQHRHRHLDRHHKLPCSDVRPGLLHIWGYIYCVGAASSPIQQVYYAPISSTGIGTWSNTTSYPVEMYAAGCSISDGYIYCVGTRKTASEAQVYYAPISSTGIGTWTSTTSYPIPMFGAWCEIPGSGGGYLSGGGPDSGPWGS